MNRPRHLRWLWWSIVIIVVYGWSLSGMDITVTRMLRGFAELHSILLDLLHPGWDYAPEVVRGLAESLSMAVIGTAFGAVLAIPLGFLAASTTWERAWPAAFGKVLLNAIRTFPELLLAIMFIRGVGPGAFAGVLAMGFHSIGFLGKVDAEIIEAVDRGAEEALRAVGATRLQTLWYAQVPQLLPEFASLAMYRFEINVRASTILGMVGAGGIGKQLLFNLAQFVWDRVSLILLGIVIVVAGIDFLSGTIRKRLV